MLVKRKEKKEYSINLEGINFKHIARDGVYKISSKVTKSIFRISWVKNEIFNSSGWVDYSKEKIIQNFKKKVWIIVS